MVKKEDKFRAYLKFKGLKFTPKRQIVLEGIFSFHKHFDVDQLYDRMRSQGKRLSRATIYRTLPLLIESDLIKEALRCQDRVRYEHIFGHEHHDHLLCLRCGRVIEFKEDGIEKLQEAICKKHDFKSVEHRLGIRGYCKKCQ